MYTCIPVHVKVYTCTCQSTIIQSVQNNMYTCTRQSTTIHMYTGQFGHMYTSKCTCDYITFSMYTCTRQSVHMYEITRVHMYKITHKFLIVYICVHSHNCTNGRLLFDCFHFCIQTFLCTLL